MPHPGRGFSQGLLAEGSAVWESVGNYGQSALRRYELGAGSVAAQAELAPEFFGEGICRVADLIWQLTWRERIALSWDAETLELREKVRYNREGWGMCAVGQAPVDGAAPLPDRSIKFVLVRHKRPYDLAWRPGSPMRAPHRKAASPGRRGGFHGFVQRASEYT